MSNINDEMISGLRVRVRDYLTEKRYLHTLAVEKEAARLGEIYLPQNIPELRAAALLHDITKKLSFEKQLQYCKKFDIIVEKGDLLLPKIFHAKTAAELVKRDFPDFASENVICGVRWHTTGRRQMSVFESLIFLADYIEETRTYDSCVKLRNYFYRKLAENIEPREKVLDMTMVLSFDMTIQELISEGAPVALDTIDARNYYIEKLKAKTESEDGNE